MTYAVKEMFLTLQGEGVQAGRRAVFVRFAGCNLWSGREQDRATAVCRFCDTDFVGTDGLGGGKFADAALLAAAQKTGLPRAQLKTRDGSVLTPDGKALSYVSLAEDAAKIAPPADIKLKPEAEWRYLGKKMRRLDMIAKCTGTATYGIDPNRIAISGTSAGAITALAVGYASGEDPTARVRAAAAEAGARSRRPIRAGFRSPRCRPVVTP